MANSLDSTAFWVALEYRVCREIAGLREDYLRDLWCDGFMPESFEVQDGKPLINGDVWMGRGGRHQEKWRFVLLLPETVASEADVAWSLIYPSDDVTGWLSFSLEKRSMMITPSAAYPDRQWKL